LNILFSSTKEKPEFWFPLLQKLLPGERFFAWPDINGGDIDIALVATHQPGTFAKLHKLRLIQSLWMGVENIVHDTDLPRGVPVARYDDADLEKIYWGLSVNLGVVIAQNTKGDHIGHVRNEGLKWGQVSGGELGPHRRHPRAGRTRQHDRGEAARDEIPRRGLEPPAEIAGRRALLHGPGRRGSSQ